MSDPLHNPKIFLGHVRAGTDILDELIDEAHARIDAAIDHITWPRVTRHPDRLIRAFYVGQEGRRVYRPRRDCLTWDDESDFIMERPIYFEGVKVGVLRGEGEDATATAIEDDPDILRDLQDWLPHAKASWRASKRLASFIHARQMAADRRARHRAARQALGYSITVRETFP